MFKIVDYIQLVQNIFIFGLFRKELLIFLFLETRENVDQLCNYYLDIKNFAAWK